MNSAKTTKSNSFFSKPAVVAFAGFLSSVALIAFIFQIGRFALLQLDSSVHASLQFVAVFPAITIDNLMEISVRSHVYAIMYPYIFTIVTVEILTFLIKKYSQQPWRSYFLFTQLSFVTFLIFSLVLFILTAVFDLSISMEWQLLFRKLDWGLQKKGLVMFLITFVIFGYQSLVLARLKNHFSSSEPENKRKVHEKIRK
ncbi:MAG: hypothetical protein LWX56_07430 [Ignavibacteria bacterium]|nr:hypothetical protein [Ignavibacteria bacterium]